MCYSGQAAPLLQACLQMEVNPFGNVLFDVLIAGIVVCIVVMFRYGCKA